MIEYTKDRPLRVFEAFAGYGSQSLACERLHRDFPDFCYKVIGFSEIDDYAIKAYHALHGNDIPNYGDISEIDWSAVPDFDLFTMSSPCQDFSSAGLQKGGAEGSGTRSSLLWECRRAILAKRPRFILFENVRALLDDKFRPYFLKWESELASYGYSNTYQVLNAMDYGVPQNRQRVFMVSILDADNLFHFPEPFPLTRCMGDTLEDDVDESFYLSDERVKGLIESTLKEKAANRGYEFAPKSINDVASTLTRGCTTRKTDNFIIIGADPKVANTLTSHYAKEKTSDLVRNAWGGVT